MSSDAPLTCRLCGCQLRETEQVVRLGTELLHVSCAEPAFHDSPEWKHRELGPLNQLVTGLGRAAVV